MPRQPHHARYRVRLAKSQREISRAIRSQPCTDCSDTFPWYVMTFDHTRGKGRFKNQSFTTGTIGSWRKFWEEIDKCDVVCGNCHVGREYSRRPWGTGPEPSDSVGRVHAGKRRLIRSLKSQPCADCRNTFEWYKMQFDHRGEEDKLGRIGDVARFSWEGLIEEIDKCDIVCTNCHLTREFHRKLVAGVFRGEAG